jgi:hypothetical protein
MSDDDNDRAGPVDEDEVREALNSSDDEAEFDGTGGQKNEEWMEEDDSIYLDEEDIDDELALPPELLAQGLSLDEKRNFFRFKKSHTNV